jgi:hypothetical protein
VCVLGRDTQWNLLFHVSLLGKEQLHFALTFLVDGLVWVIALRPQTPKHIRSGLSNYTDTSEPVDGNGAQIW